MGSDGLAGLQIGFGIRVRCARDGKHTNKSAEGAVLPSLPFMVTLPTFSYFPCFPKFFLFRIQMYGFGGLGLFECF